MAIALTHPRPELASGVTAAAMPTPAFTFEERICPACVGSGHGRHAAPCGVCHGDGVLVRKRRKRRLAQILREAWK